MNIDLAKQIYIFIIKRILFKLETWLIKDLSDAYEDKDTLDLVQKAYRENLLQKISQVELINCAIRAAQSLKEYARNEKYDDILSLNLEDWPRIEENLLNTIQEADRKKFLRDSGLKDIETAFQKLGWGYRLIRFYVERLDWESSRTLLNLLEPTDQVDEFLEKIYLPESRLAGDETTDAPPPAGDVKKKRKRK